VPQSVAHLICVPQVPQMWHKMWHNSIYILSTNFTNGATKPVRALIKHGEINALEDSIAAPQKVVYQPFAKNQKLAPQVPQTSHFVVICVTMSDLEDSNNI